MACLGSEAKGALVEGGNSATLLDFLHKSRLPVTVRLSAEEIDRQIIEEREAWE